MEVPSPAASQTDSVFLCFPLIKYNFAIDELSTVTIQFRVHR
ncbi:hypothetical protein Pan258_31310 [Symmachiella dynata]|nr:hypothetical protein Pan258_31310 [Symmachiella dynata]